MIFMAADSGHCILMILIVLSAAFHTVHHVILLSQLEQFLGILAMS